MATEQLDMFGEAPEPLLDEESQMEGESLKEEMRELLAEVIAREEEMESGWWKDADEAEKIYNNEDNTANIYTAATPYNVLYSNTEVLLPSLYSATPKPDIRARYGINPKLKPVVEVIDRFLTVTADSGVPGLESFDEAMKDAVLGALTPGMGTVRLRYYPGRTFPLVFESVHYRSVLWSKGKRWGKVRWMAFKHEFTREELEDKFELSEENMDAYSPKEDQDKTKDGDRKSIVYEVWSKEKRQTLWLSEDWREVLIQAEPDIMQLECFFPTPGLLLLTNKPGKIRPSPLYAFYRNQAEELNRVTVRLNRVLQAIKVRGAYNSLLGDDLKKILSDEGDTENALVPASEGVLMGQTGGFDKHLWLLPLEKLITVAQTLYQSREQIKQVIYEITGLSDIIRGSAKASETATAQDLKNKWGTIRLRKMQNIVALYARDLFRLAVDCASNVLPPEKWLEITQMQLPTMQQKAQMQMQMQMMQMQMPPPGAMPPGSPPPPQMQQMQQMMASLQVPSIEEVLMQIKSDVNRSFTINIQTASTIDIDTASDKADVHEFMNAMGQLLSGLAPLAQLGPTGFEAAKQMLVSVCQRFKFGQDIAETLGKMTPPPPPQEKPDPKAEAEAKVAQAEAQAKIEEINAQKMLNQAKMQLEQEKMQLEREKMQAERQKLTLDVQRAELAFAAQRAKLQRPQGQAGNASV